MQTSVTSLLNYPLLLQTGLFDTKSFDSQEAISETPGLKETPRNNQRFRLISLIARASPRTECSISLRGHVLARELTPREEKRMLVPLDVYDFICTAIFICSVASLREHVIETSHCNPMMWCDHSQT